MGLDAHTQAFIERASLNPAPAPGELPLDEFRAAVAALAPLGFDAEEVHEVHDVDVDGVPVRCYRPVADRVAPLIVCAHGGSWVRMTVELQDSYYRALANRTGCVLAAVDYTLAPEATFPTAIEQVHAAARWATEHAGEVGGDASRLAILGESSGGNLAAAAALYARDRGDVTYTQQILVLPVLDTRFASASWDALGRDYLLTKDQLEWAVEQYAPGVDRTDPLLSPLCADDLSGLPPALVVTGEFDPLRDDGIMYAERLEQAGVPVRRWDVAGLIHHTLMVPKAIPLGQQVLDELGTKITETLAAARS